MKVLESQDQNTFCLIGNKEEMKLLLESVTNTWKNETNKIKKCRFYVVKHFLEKNLCVF